MLKDTAKRVLDLMHHRIYVPSHGVACTIKGKPRDHHLRHGTPEEHLREAMAWLRRAHLACGEEGVAARYTFRDGWLHPYPETTGYIIPTFFAYADHANEPQFQEMGLTLADWLLNVQMPSGAFPGGHLDQGCGPVIFNTGQILIGLLAAYRLCRDPVYGEACRSTGQWLTEVIDEDGAWRRFTYKDRFHAYHTRVAWPLVDAGLLFNDEAMVAAGRANLDFAITLQEANGWFNHNTLDEEEIPFTHTLAYVARGLLEAGILLEEERYIDSAKKMALAMLDDFENRGYLAGQFDQEMNPVEGFSCVTGCAQISIVWQKLHQLNVGVGNRFLDGALKINRQAMHCQDLDASNAGIRGAVPGSWPMSGPYIRYGYPNWAAKFLADALMLEIRSS